MTSLHELTTTQLKQAIQLREQIDSLQEKFAALMGGAAPVGVSKKKTGRAKGKRTISPEHRAKLAAAQKARWAKLKGKSAPAKASKPSAPVKSSTKSAPKKKQFSPETRAKLAASMKARWAARKKKSESVLNATAN